MREFFVGGFSAVCIIGLILIFLVFDAEIANFRTMSLFTPNSREFTAGVFMIPQEKSSSEEYVPFPRSEFILREGNIIFYPPKPKYLDLQYIDINVKEKLLTLFDNGEAKKMYRIVAVGSPSSPTPKGTFKILHKEEKHFASKEKVWMPWSIHIVGDVFIHGIPYYPNGRLLQSKYSHGCIRVPTEQQKELYHKASVGMQVVVY